MKLAFPEPLRYSTTYTNISEENAAEESGTVEVKGKWLKAVRHMETEGNNFMRSHRNEDLETALKALEIAEGSLKGVTEHYERTR